MNPVLNDYLDDHRDDALHLLERLCRQPSISTQNVGMEEMVSLLETVLGEHGFETQRIPAPTGYPVIYGVLKGKSDKTLLFYNHYDVQPAEPLELWNSPPFTPTLRDGKLYARGVADNKGEIAARLAAIAALRTQGELPFTIKYILEGEEEMGSPSFGKILADHEQLLKCDDWLTEGSGLNRQGQPVITLGAKGILYVQYEVTEANIDMHSSIAATVPSAAWKLVYALNTLRDEHGHILIDGFYDDVAPITPELKAAIAKLPDEGEAMAQQLGIRHFIDNVTGQARIERMLTASTANIAGLTSGYQADGMKTVLPAAASAKMDFRLVPNQDPHDIFEKLRRHLDKHGFQDVNVKLLAAEAPAHAELDDPFVHFVDQVAREYYNKEPVVNPWSAGTLPLEPMFKHLGPHGLCGPGNPTYWGSAAHAPNENIRLDDLYTAVHYNADLLQHYGQS